MNAITPGLGMDILASAPRETPEAWAARVRWAVLMESSRAVAALAGRNVDETDVAMPFLAGDEPCEDLAAVMQNGMAALLETLDRGRDCRAAADALWREFTVLRDLIVRSAVQDATRQGTVAA